MVCLCCRLQSKGLVLAVDIKNAFRLHPTCRLNNEHLSNGGRQVSLSWVSKLARGVSVVLLFRRRELRLFHIYMPENVLILGHILSNKPFLPSKLLAVEQILTYHDQKREHRL